MLELGTLAGARALGLAVQMGTLTPGKLANFTVIRIDDSDRAAAGSPRAAFRSRGPRASNLDPRPGCQSAGYSRQFVIWVSRIAEAPSTSSCSMISITSVRRTMTRTAHQIGIFQRADRG